MKKQVEMQEGRNSANSANKKISDAITVLIGVTLVSPTIKEKGNEMF